MTPTSIPMTDLCIKVILCLPMCFLAEYGNAQGPGSLPFASSSSFRRPSVSAYQQLSNFADNQNLGGNVYQQMVQPLLQQQQFELNQATERRRLGEIQSAVGRLSSEQTNASNQTIRPTGHSATFLNYSHFYPVNR